MPKSKSKSKKRADDMSALSGESSLKFGTGLSLLGPCSVNSDCESSVPPSIFSSINQDQPSRQNIKRRTSSSSTSDPMIWQDTEDSNEELISSDEDEESTRLSDKVPHRRAKKPTSKDSKKKRPENGVESQSQSDHSSGVHTSSTNSTKQSAVSEVLFHSLDENDDPGDHQKTSTGGIRLQFSAGAIAEVANSRLKNEDRHKPKKRPQQHHQPGKQLEFVNYVSSMDMASTNKDLSTTYQLEKEDCEAVFCERVPFEIPASKPNDHADDMSSIHHGVSTKIPDKDVMEEEKVGASEDIESMGEKKDQVVQKQSEKKTFREYVETAVGNRSEMEICLMTVAAVSVLTLIVLLLLITLQKSS